MAGDVPGPDSDSALDEMFYRTERVQFVYWRQFSGAKTTVMLTTAIAVLAFVTGLSDLSQATVELNGPLATFLPGPSDAVRLYGVFFAFIVGGLTVGLQRRVRLAWYGTVVALPMIALLPLLTADSTDIPLLLATMVAFPLVVYNRGKFDKPIDLSPFQTAALTAFVAVQIYGTLGTYAMRDRYTGIASVTDAFYYIIVTGTTVGYGDATPTDPLTKLFTVSVIVLGTGSFTLASGSLLIPALESRISAAFGNMTASELTLLEDHVLVLGYSELTEPLIDVLAPATDVVVVTPDAESASELTEFDVNVLTDDPTDEETLLDARVDTAKGVVVAGDDDAQDVLMILAARQANPDVRIVAAANDQKHVDKLEGVGADTVISPTLIGGQMLGQSILDEDDDPV
ncbi:NAD-binding protein [Haloarculaceae archaeon H-GB2-1]|nr:NAD-binding protein [Haloarculaceae archaeon H-GB1-1]MEA5387362.1 NAD-binding protein [Haloarculaceae archaeon H-GB11]MEA5408831.1 NAD-binding protein [Haloarculaceae archaeon H-GB2-1]